jgi:hypothetical protein
MPPEQNNVPPVNNPAPNNPIPPKPPRSHTFLLILTALLLLTGAFGVWYFSNPVPEDTVEEIALTNKFSDSAAPMAGWKTYRNE